MLGERPLTYSGPFSAQAEGDTEGHKKRPQRKEINNVQNNALLTHIGYHL